MKITTARRISQIFFFVLFLWFCIVCSLGTRWFQLRGWPVNWLLQLDPLVALGTMLSTHTLFSGLTWALVTIIATIFVGRFFCGWLCPFGTIHQFFGYLGRKNLPFKEKVAKNQYKQGQTIKYYILFFMLAAASGNLLFNIIRYSHKSTATLWILSALLLLTLTSLTAFQLTKKIKSALSWTMGIAVLWVVPGIFFSRNISQVVSLQIGLLDPLPLVYRSVNLVVLPLADSALELISPDQRLYQSAWSIGLVFLIAVLANFYIPRFYCRFICPLGALFGVMSRFALWRIGKPKEQCSNCELCETDCEGACNPYGKIRISECLMCMNCLHGCKKAEVTYSPQRSAAGEITAPDISRRGFVMSLLSGFAIVPLARSVGNTDTNWNHKLVRPPGALSEEDFLSRCIKCGQCMRICPTNVLQPAGFEGGVEGLWTPMLNFRIGESGCQLNCIACGNICPTAAIRPITLDEKRGRGKFAHIGPIRMGTAFVDRSRCLPWAMDRPCIVCEENCPVSPKSIYVEEITRNLHHPELRVKQCNDNIIFLKNSALKQGELAGGDYFCAASDSESILPILDNNVDSIEISGDQPDFVQNTTLQIKVRLQRPHVDPKLCIGCGVCQHECPVSGKRAIRVSAENESRNASHAFFTIFQSDQK